MNKSTAAAAGTSVKSVMLILEKEDKTKKEKNSILNFFDEENEFDDVKKTKNTSATSSEWSSSLQLGRRFSQSATDLGSRAHFGDSDEDEDYEYRQTANEFFGKSKLWSSLYTSSVALFSRKQQCLTTTSERKLLDALVHVSALNYKPRPLEPAPKHAAGRMPLLPKPTQKKVRPSSAQANLQTSVRYGKVNAVNSPYDGRRPSSALGSQRPVTHAGVRTAYQPATINEDQPATTGPPPVVERVRRNTISLIDGIATTEIAFQARLSTTLATNLKSKLEEKINIETLEDLKKAFETASYGSEGKLDLVQFKELLKAKLHITGSKTRKNRILVQQIDALFQKIDWSSEGLITWDEFCTYMQLEYAEKEDSYLRAKEVCFHRPAKIENMPHREQVLRISDTADGHVIACSKDGLVSFWSGSLDLKRQRTVVTVEQSTRQKQKWITDFVIMPHYNKFIVATGDREIQFFELSSFEPYCQISGFETVPLKLDYCSTGHDECMILYGDSMGCINILVINNAGECLRTWKKMPKTEGIASVGIEVVANSPSCKFIRWKVHDDWVQEVKYYNSIRQVISCSNHSGTALVIGYTQGSTQIEQQMKDQNTNHEKPKQKISYSWKEAKHRLKADQTVFKIYKGVKTFDFSKSKNVIVTGGMDRILRIWNPYVSGKPTATIRGHSAPISYLRISEEENRIYSVSTDKCVKVWDIQDHNCIHTIRPKGHKIRGDLQTCFYSIFNRGLVVATDQMAMISQVVKPHFSAEIPVTHKEAIHCIKYNPSFKQLITCSDGSVVKIWDFESGNLIFEFNEAHGESAITCVSFDNTDRRLITGGRDGCLRIWNYNNGHCLRTMQKEADNEEICSVCYVEMNRNRYVIAVGWDRRINMYTDNSEGVHHISHPLPNWADDIANGHKEDILSVAVSSPSFLATSSYDGEVIVWNLISGHIFCHLHAPEPRNYEHESLDGDLSVNKLLFLKSRSYNKDAGSLISSGPRGHIHFWGVYNGGKLMAQFPGSHRPGVMVTTMEVDRNDKTLYTADSMGFIYVWKIEGYATNGPTIEPPELLIMWRGHIDSVTALDLVEDHKMIITASLDCTVRLWTFDGDYIGTFGQPDPWDVFDPSTFQHPMVPYDVLVDPLSLPSHPVLDRTQSIDGVVDGDSAQNSDTEEKVHLQEKPTTPTYIGKSQFFVDDDAIAEQIAKKPFRNGTGKRLRHEKNKPIRIDRGGPSEYQSLKCFDLADTPIIDPPKLKVNRNDPFAFYDDD
ncbi:cilia- and flagella-associated protein 337-like [Tubulanus polymorphus]|uniref:cilia- and flagella-associated protein 337-like n=1 Tax=Tubulanus polymorphus TaxID=672921 RepID=UPI003DA2C233